MSQETILILLSVFFLIAIICLMVIWYLRRHILENEAKKRLVEAEKQLAEERKDKVSLLQRQWDVYSKQYEYFVTMNLNQHRSVFYWSFGMIVAGFLVIGAGFFYDYRSPQPTKDLSLAAIIGGVIIEFIAGTILVIFRSVVEQTTDHRKTLERFISIGIAVSMLADMPKIVQENDLKHKTAAELAKLVIVHQLGTSAHFSSTDVVENKKTTS